MCHFLRHCGEKSNLAIWPPRKCKQIFTEHENPFFLQIKTNILFYFKCYSLGTFSLANDPMNWPWPFPPDNHYSAIYFQNQNCMGVYSVVTDCMTLRKWTMDHIGRSGEVKWKLLLDCPVHLFWLTTMVWNRECLYFISYIQKYTYTNHKLFTIVIYIQVIKV